MTTRQIFCCGCGKDVMARLTDGREVYPHRPDLADIPRWKCDACGNHVGCHHKTKDRTRPLGCIPTPEIVNARRHIHRILDPLWQGRNGQKLSRRTVYAMLANALGKTEYHTAEIRSVEEGREVYRAVQKLALEIGTP